MKIDFNGRSVLVTGAGRGIGRVIVERLLSSNARVIALSKTDANLQSLKQQYPSVETVCVDITNWEQTRTAVSRLGHIDGLVNNAAFAYCEPLQDVTPQIIDKHFDTNVKAAINLTQIVSDALKRRGCGGSIVNISSMASIKALANHLAYSASKAALDMITKISALELGPYNIRVNSVNPTVTLTEMAEVGWSDPVKRSNMLNTIPMNRFVNPEEVANAVVYLLSDESSMITGVLLPVDGGLSAT